MAEEVTGFWGHLGCFLLHDDKARWKAIGWIIFISGTGGSIDLALENSSLDDAIFLMGAMALILSFIWISWYCLFKPYHDIETSLSRRGLILRAVASMAGLFVGVFLSRIQARALDSDLSQALITNDYQTAAHIFERARAASIRLNSTLVRTASQKFIGVDQPAAWNAVTACLNYQSSPSSGSAKIPIPLTMNPEETNYAIPHANILQPPKGSTFGVSTAPNIPELRFQDATSLNENVKVGPAKLLLENGSMKLDRLYLRRIVFRNMRILYMGDPLEMEDVSFVNCTFEISQSERGRRFAQAIIAPSPSITLNL